MEKSMKIIYTLISTLFLASTLSAEPVIIMKHGDTVVTKEDMHRFIELVVPPQQRANVYSNEKTVRDLIAQYFVTRKLVELNKDQPLSEDEQWRADTARVRELASIYMQKVVAAAKKPDFEKRAHEAYLANLARYEIPEEVRVEHILIGLEDRSDEEAKKRAEEVLAKLKKKDADFAELAKEYSDDKSVQNNNGDMGFFSRGRMVAPFEEAAFAMQKKGELSGPVKTQFGYHILRFIDRNKARTRSFDEIKKELIEAEERQFNNETAMNEYNRIGALEGIEVDQEAIESMITKIDVSAILKAKEGEEKKRAKQK